MYSNMLHHVLYFEIFIRIYRVLYNVLYASYITYINLSKILSSISFIIPFIMSLIHSFIHTETNKYTYIHHFIDVSGLFTELHWSSFSPVTVTTWGQHFELCPAIGAHLAVDGALLRQTLQDAMPGYFEGAVILDIVKSCKISRVTTLVPQPTGHHLRVLHIMARAASPLPARTSFGPKNHQSFWKKMAWR